MSWRAVTRVLDALPDGAFDLVHIQTPFIAHYAGVRCARRAGVPCVATYHTFFEEYLHHYLPVLPHGLSRLLARSFTRSQCADVQASAAFYDAVLVTLGHTRLVTRPGTIGYGKKYPEFWLNERRA